MLKKLGFAAAMAVVSSAQAAEPLFEEMDQSFGAQAVYRLQFGGDRGLAQHSLGFANGPMGRAQPAVEYRWTRAGTEMRVAGVTTSVNGVPVLGVGDTVLGINQFVFFGIVATVVVTGAVAYENNQDDEAKSGGTGGSGS